MSDSNNPDNEKPAQVDGDIMKMGFYGIKCDTPGCGWHDDDVRYEEYPKWIDKPCPNCEAPLLTKKQLQETEAMISAAKAMNDMSPEDMQKQMDAVASLSEEEQKALLHTLPDWMKAMIN